jgi:hypothetical protein
MQGEPGQHWRELCEQAATEQDPNRLMELVNEINRMLSEKEERLKRRQQEQHEQPKARESVA